MSDRCPSCGGPVEQRSGPGRPPIYCGDGCRRAAEFAIRGLVRRVDAAERELREQIARDGGTFGYLDEGERGARVKALRKWLREDQAKLRKLLGARPARKGRDPK